MENKAIEKISKSLEAITRRNMKIQVSDYIKELCTSDEEFAEKVMNPKKDLPKCFRYINRMAQDWLKEEAKANGDNINGGYGGDVPDDICFNWAAEYFDKDGLPEDDDKPKTTQKPEAKPASGNEKKQTVKPAPKKKKAEPVVEQLSLLG